MLCKEKERIWTTFYILKLTCNKWTHYTTLETGWTPSYDRNWSFCVKLWHVMNCNNEICFIFCIFYPKLMRYTTMRISALDWRATSYITIFEKIKKIVDKIVAPGHYLYVTHQKNCSIHFKSSGFNYIYYNEHILWRAIWCTPWCRLCFHM